MKNKDVANDKRIWLIVGDRKLTDMQALARCGKPRSAK